VKLFDLEARGTTVAREVRGGTATFLTMAYILFANPAILSAAGMPFGPVVAATAAASALASLLMALGANFPIALAPGMGLNAVIAYQVAPAAGSWQAAMGLVVADGLLMLALVLIGLRGASPRHPARPAPRHRRGHRAVHRLHRRGERSHRGRHGQHGGRAVPRSAGRAAAGHLRLAARS